MRKVYLSFFILLFALGLQAQPWMQKLTSKNPTFEELRSAFHSYWKENPVERGKGYKPFRRWEWFMQNRLTPEGRLPEAGKTWKAWNEYQLERGADLLRTTSANWSFLGPQSSAGGYSGIGRVNCIAFHPTDPNTFWIGTPAGGIWKTINGGTTWTTNTDYFPVLGVSDIAIDPANANIMYVASGDGEGSFSLSALTGAARGDTKSIGVLKSTDGGNTWNTTGLNWNVSNAKLIRRLIINPANSQLLVAATSDGIYRTTNGGGTWTQEQSGYFMDAEFKPGDPTIVYAATSSDNSEIYRSTNSGDTWTLVSTLTGVTRINMAVTNAYPALIDLVGVNNQSGLAGLWYSDNSGATFSQYLTGTNANNMLHNSYNASGAGGQGHYDLAYAISPTDYNDIWLGGVNSWQTSNGGTTWTLKTMWNGHPSSNPNGAPVVHADKHFIAFHPLVPGTMFECNDGGLYKTTNGGTSWTDISNGLGISQIYRIGVNQNFAGDVLCGLQDNGSKEIYNNTWYDQTGGDGMECIIDYTNGNVMYATYVDGQISKTTNGTAWGVIVQNNGTTGTVHEAGEWVTPYVMHPTNNNTLLVGKSQVYKTTDGGDTWSQLGPISGMNGYKIMALAYAPSNPQVIYAATRLDIFKTADGGATWAKVGSADGLSVPNTFLAVDPSDANKLYVTIGGYAANDKVWLLNTTTTSIWTSLVGTLPNVPVNCITIDKNNGGMYIGTDVGVFYRGKTMNDWEYFNTGLPNVVVTELEIAYNENKLYAATFGRGLWRSDLYQATVSYVFNGTGNWSTATNWLNGSLPPAVIPANVEVIIDPAGNGECVHTGDLTIPKNVKLTIKPNKRFRVTGNLVFQQ